MKETGKTLLNDLFNLGDQATQIGYNLKNETKDYIKGKVESLISEMDLVTREEMEAWNERFVKLEEENSELKKKLTKLEKKTPKKETN